MYIVRRSRDRRLVAGIFYCITTQEEAAAIAARFEHNEGESFMFELIEE
jgi:hypothetical protein